jgi:putative proteasome-type protease
MSARSTQLTSSEHCRVYGKFLLELAAGARVPLETAAKVALSSMVSTAHANVSVGPPYDFGLYRNGSHQVEHARIAEDSSFLARLSDVWARHLSGALNELPMMEPGEFTML